jgi:hypothetical protein
MTHPVEFAARLAEVLATANTGRVAPASAFGDTTE